ncbi:pseudouridine synthase [Liquorilactobacillus capillatus]|uniref:Pseudouridine synthase n=1 Tax=Liquorilactobacillus capillatus DSM 19910 TaxID=1423731 RepID=A0A0R1MDD9_9LACO|nr:pseudouridine synthase [Liquorilactobacillus capillatus]KRL03138.1 ribosomal small subunit pseudouridine synthase A [Liquorilactobacillus capillatus DSM 19910]
MRIDKYLAKAGLGTRSQVRKLIKEGKVTLNQQYVKSGKVTLDEKNDRVEVAGKTIVYQPFFYYMLNKPQGVICATVDAEQKTVLDLLDEAAQNSSLFPVGRLDKDTTGLVLITNDGKLAHRLLSPAHHISKVYQVKVAGLIDEGSKRKLKEGMILRNGERVKGAEVQILQTDQKNSWLRLTITEGKYHQIKRMIGSLSMRVLTLKRIKMGSLVLDSGLDLGEYRELTAAEIANLKEKRRGETKKYS